MILTFETEIIIGIALCLVILIGRHIWLEIKLHKLLRGKSGKDLESTLMDIRSDYKKLDRFRTDMDLYLREVEHKLRQSTRGIATIRFNPFKGNGEGGNQSFATAFINELGNGVVISSIYTRERYSIFSKPLANFTSTFELTEEEAEAVKNARTTFEHKRP